MIASLKGVARFSVLVVAAAAIASPAFADKPDWAGGGHDRGDRYEHERGDRHERERYRDDRERERGEREDERRGFDARARERVLAYYAREMRRGHCPPGLRRKHNGCAPPGQAKKWTIGERLPRDVVYQDLSPQVTVEIGVPPAGYRYVQVANDILMIAAGSGMVVDAINDLGR
jgi:Ni/Co efflux regulator RcnB